MSVRRVLAGTAGSLAMASTAAMLALFVVSGTTGGAAGTIAAAIIYMTPLMMFQAATERPFGRWVDAARFPFDWFVYGGTKLAIGVAAAITGSVLMLLFGFATSWQNLYLANRMVVVVSLIGSCAVRLYSTTRSRLEE